MEEQESETPMVRNEVTPQDVADVVALQTGVPVSKMLEEETTKLLSMEDKLKERVVGQDHAVTAISKAVRRGPGGASRRFRRESATTAAAMKALALQPELLLPLCDGSLLLRDLPRRRGLHSESPFDCEAISQKRRAHLVALENLPSRNMMKFTSSR